MCAKKLICLASFVVILSLVGNVQGQTATWTDAGPGHLWSTPGNWSEFPTDAHWAKVRNGLPGPTIASEGAVALKIAIGYAEGGALTVDGGSLTTIQDIEVSRGGVGTLNMISGTITVGRDLEVGRDYESVVNMTGGTIIVGRNLAIPEGSGHTTHVNLDGGTLIVNDSLDMSDGGTMDIAGGTLIVNADVLSAVQGYIDNGWITTYGGNGTAQLDYDVTNEAQTTLKGVHKLKPNPIDGGLVAPGALELSWTLPDPCVPNQPVSVDVYFTDDLQALEYFTDPAAIQVVSKQSVTSVVVQAQPKTRYYWAVDTYVGDPNDPIFGPIFSFVADNAPPKVDAGADAVSWLIDGVRTENLDVTVTDDDAYTVQWTVISEPDDPNSPDAVITDPSAEDTSITLSALGEYVLQLEAFDGEYTGSDTMTINVYSDHCEAAKSLPGWTPSPGDINLDCVVDQADLDLLCEQWLNCNGLDCPHIDPIEPNVP